MEVDLVLGTMTRKGWGVGNEVRWIDIYARTVLTASVCSDFAKSKVVSL